MPTCKNSINKREKSIKKQQKNRKTKYKVPVTRQIHTTFSCSKLEHYFLTISYDLVLHPCSTYMMDIPKIVLNKAQTGEIWLISTA